ncbi:MAG: hypothetical protein U1F34_07705 [Gammaproteobacteria bacterium]
MNAPNKHQDSAATLGLIGIGSLLLIIAIFTDPIGPSPDSGIIDLGQNGTRWLLGVLGGILLLAGAWTVSKRK